MIDTRDGPVEHGLYCALLAPMSDRDAPTLAAVMLSSATRQSGEFWNRLHDSWRKSEFVLPSIRM